MNYEQQLEMLYEVAKAAETLIDVLIASETLEEVINKSEFPDYTHEALEDASVALSRCKSELKKTYEARKDASHE